MAHELDGCMHDRFNVGTREDKVDRQKKINSQTSYLFSICERLVEFKMSEFSNLSIYLGNVLLSLAQIMFQPAQHGREYLFLGADIQLIV